MTKNKVAWREQAKCRGENPDYFHPPDGQSWMAIRGLAICETCPVTKQCLAFALSFDQADDMHGVYGATTAKERRHIRQGKPFVRKTPGPPRQIITGLDELL
jgi:WhiB family transcriptional regulator, redox-sensing transcriptional regulator